MHTVIAEVQAATAGDLLTPTAEIHLELNLAFKHFNTSLFDDRLPTAIVTLVQRRGRVRGHFAAERFERRNGSEVRDEIALNPRHFKDRTPVAILSTVAHEMVHLEQHHFGRRRPRSAWHGREWADDMERIGLIPTDTGLPGGKRTGRDVTHIVKPGGRFWVAAKALLDSGGVRMDWVHREWVAEPSFGELKAAALSGKRVKYWCPTCPPGDETAVWGRHGQHVMCGRCRRPLNAS